MKAVNTIIKILVALAAIAGAVYVAATYGDQIVAWCKKIISGKCCCQCACEESECSCEESECSCEEAVAEIVAEEAPVAAETDFES